MKALGIIQGLLFAGCGGWAIAYLCGHTSPYVWGSLLAGKVGLLVIALATKGRHRWPAFLFAALALVQIALVLWFLIKGDAIGDVIMYATFGLALTYGAMYCYMDRVYLYKNGHLGMAFHNGQWVHRIGRPPEFPVAPIDLHAPFRFRKG